MLPMSPVSPAVTRFASVGMRAASLPSGALSPLRQDSVHFGSQEQQKDLKTDAPVPSSPVEVASDASTDAPKKGGAVSYSKRLAKATWDLTKQVFSYSLKPFKWLGGLLLKPFAKMQPKLRLKNAVDNAIGYPRHQKLVKAGIWAGATFAIGCIPIPGFQALLAAAPVTFLTTLLVDFAVGFFDGLTKDPEKMRAVLDQWREQSR